MKDNKSLIRSLFLSMLCLLLVVGSGTFAVAQQVSRIVAVSIGEVNGSAEILLKRDAGKGKGEAQLLSQAWKPVAPQISINPGDQLRTNADSSLKLNLNDGTVLTLAENSMLQVESLQSARENQPRTAEFRLENGTVSTVQTAKTLGQTVQIIRTNNGSVDTRLGEVEITKISDEYAKVAAALPEGSPWPFVAQRSKNKDVTIVRLIRGTAQVQATGQGDMVTDSMLMPDSCIAEDGVKFTLRAPKTQVKIAKLPDINGFELSSAEPFQMLVATEGSANSVKLFNRKGVANVDIEGISVAEQDENSTLKLLLNSILTVGVKASEMTVSLACSQDESEGLDFKVLGADGGVNMVRDSLGGGRDQNPSRGAVSAVPTKTPLVRTPTPTPTVVWEEETPGGKPTPTPTPTTPDTSQPGGSTTSIECGSPITHTFPRNPMIVLNPAGITGLQAPLMQVGTTGACGTGGTPVTIQFAFANYLPQIMPGRLSLFITDPSWSPIAPGFYSVIQPVGVVQVLDYTYTNNTQLETGHISYQFCFNPNPSQPGLYFYVYIYDRCGNQSNRMRCSADIATPASLTCQTP